MRVYIIGGGVEGRGHTVALCDVTQLFGTTTLVTMSFFCAVTSHVSLVHDDMHAIEHKLQMQAHANEDRVSLRHGRVCDRGSKDAAGERCWLTCPRRTMSRVCRESLGIGHSSPPR